jgi:DNA polymerase-1
MRITCLDTMNLIHRARSGFAKGPHAITYNFFRQLRPIIELANPDKVYLVLEGSPTHRQEVEGIEYKGGRKDAGDDFYRQVNEIIQLISEALPFDIMKADELECDDVIANLAIYHDDKGDDVTIISGDSDFIQILDDRPTINLYHPIKKKHLEQTPYHYLTWKSLTGDSSDNIPGIPRVGPKTAEKLLMTEGALESFLEDEEKEKIFKRNYGLIEFVSIDNFEPDEYMINTSNLQSSHLCEAFERMGFTSLVKEKTFKKYIKTFELINSKISKRR